MIPEEEEGYPVKVGDLVRYNWDGPNSMVIGLVTDVWDPPNSHAKIDYTLEILDSNGKKILWDVWTNGPEPEIISRETR